VWFIGFYKADNRAATAAPVAAGEVPTAVASDAQERRTPLHPGDRPGSGEAETERLKQLPAAVAGLALPAPAEGLGAGGGKPQASPDRPPGTEAQRAPPETSQQAELRELGVGQPLANGAVEQELARCSQTLICGTLCVREEGSTLSPRVAHGVSRLGERMHSAAGICLSCQALFTWASVGPALLVSSRGCAGESDVSGPAIACRASLADTSEARSEFVRQLLLSAFGLDDC
jgi:hypothetical protein